jgi:hypothetical protein
LALLPQCCKGETVPAVRQVICISLSVLAGCAVATNDEDRVGSFDAAIEGRADAAQDKPDAEVITFPDASTVDASPQCTVQPLELLNNGDFDLGPGGWDEDGTFPLIVSDSEIDGVSADSGTYLVWLGGYLATAGTAVDTIAQDIAVPGDATPAVLSGSIWVDSEDSILLAFDTLTLTIVDSQTQALRETVATWSNVNQGSGWVGFSHTLGDSYAGESLRLVFTSTVDDVLRTSFLLDSISLETTSCQ